MSAAEGERRPFLRHPAAFPSRQEQDRGHSHPWIVVARGREDLESPRVIAILGQARGFGGNVHTTRGKSSKNEIIINPLTIINSQ